MFYSKSDYNTNPGEYRIHTYDKVHGYEHVHEYNHVHEYKNIHEYNKVREYKTVHKHNYREYELPKTERKESKTQRTYIPPKRQYRRKSNLPWPDRTIYTHTYRPYEYRSPPPYREYEYREYHIRNEDYMTRNTGTYNGWYEYKLTPENFPPFRYRKKTTEIENDLKNSEKMSFKGVELMHNFYQEKQMTDLPTAFDYLPKTVSPKYQEFYQERKLNELTSEIVFKPPTPKHHQFYQEKELEALPTAVVNKPPTPPQEQNFYQQKETEVLPAAIVYKPPSPKHQYFSQFKQEEELPVAFVYAPKVAQKLYSPTVHPTPLATASEVVERQPPYTNATTPLSEIDRTWKNTPGPKPVIAAMPIVIRSVNTESKSSPVSSKSEYTPIRSRSPTQRLTPVGTAVVGGLAGAAIVDQKADAKTVEERQVTPQNQATHSQQNTQINTAAFIGGAAGVANTSNKTKQRKNKTPKNETPVKEPKYEASPEQIYSPQKLDSPVLKPVPLVAANASTLKSPVFKSTTPKRYVQNNENQPVVRGGLIAAASIPGHSSSKAEQSKTHDHHFVEAPSTWTPLPEEQPPSWSPVYLGYRHPEAMRIVKQTRLPPEVIATIEAYNRCHNN